MISPTLTGSCRFVPTCADYTAEAIARHGFLRGCWLGAIRLSKCQPFGPSGHDAVPIERRGTWGSRLETSKKTLPSLMRRVLNRTGW